MRLSKISITNYRSIKSVSNLRIEPLQAFVGENDAGKSNILRGLDCFLGTGATGIEKDDFNDPETPVIMEAEFTSLSEAERKKLRTYLIGDKLILQKLFILAPDPKTGKNKVSAEYHGYKAEPKDWWLSIDKITAKDGVRPKWSDIAQQRGLTTYVTGDDGKINKASYTAGLDRYLTETEVEYDEPELGKTQALGIQQNLLSALPDFYLLPAITNYSDEIDSRSTSTVFRRLMSDLSERFIRKDPRYAEIENALGKLRSLLNLIPGDAENARLESLAGIETRILENVKRLMPTVNSVHLGVEIDEPRNIFAKGVSIKIHDGVLTDVLDKGNGMQRCLVFSLLQLLMQAAKEKKDNRPIILAIEEPELYIHPQLQRLIFKVLKDFAGIQPDDSPATGTDQVLYSTHSPAFVDVARYEQIGLVRKENTAVGTTVTQCSPGVLGSPDERKGFKLLTSFGLRHNEVFFSRYAILVEGPEDEIATIACGRKLNKFVELPDELRFSIVVAGNKEEIPKFQKVLNAFGFRYSVLLELDGRPEDEGKNKDIIDLAGTNIVSKLPNRLEDAAALGKPHFKDVFEAKQFFSDPAKITADIEQVVGALFPTLGGPEVQQQPAQDAAATTPTA